jgi:molybdopterin synthase sulfur carrier subunit
VKQIEIQLFGALRDAERGALLAFPSDATTVGQLRADLASRIAAWPEGARALLPKCAFASTTTVLRDGDALPDDGRLALLPPVSGG